MKKYIFELFISILFLPVFSTAQQTVDLFSEAQREQVSDASSLDFLSRVSNDYALVTLNGDDFSEVEKFEFNLFGDPVSLENINQRINDQGYQFFTGDVFQEEIKTGYFMFSYIDQSLTGAFVLSDYTYEMQPLGDGIHLLEKTRKGDFREDGRRIPECDTEERRGDRPKGGSPRSLPPLCGDNSIMKLVVCYTPSFGDRYATQAGVNGFLVALVESLNEVYISSDISVRVRLVFTLETISDGFDDKTEDLGHFGINDSAIFPFAFGPFDEVFHIKDIYRADAALLITNSSYGGRAERSLNIGIYGGTWSAFGYGAAHEVGHMFDLNHSQGHIGPTPDGDGDHSTSIMIQNGTDRDREPLHSDPTLTFTTGDPAGDDNYGARDDLEDHKDNVITFDDYEIATVGNFGFAGHQMSNLFAKEEISIEFFTADPMSRGIFQAGDQISLGVEADFLNGSDMLLRINDCEESAGFRSKPPTRKESLTREGESHVEIYPNPTKDRVMIDFVLDHEDLVNVSLVNANGQLVRSLMENQRMNAGQHQIPITVKDLPAGIYFINYQTDHISESHRLILTN